MALINIALYCSKAEIIVPVVQTDFRVKPTTKLLWVAFGLGCCCLAWLWGYDNFTMFEEMFVSAMFVQCSADRYLL